MRKSTCLLLSAVLLCSGCSDVKTLYKSRKFTVTTDAVIQGKFKAEVISDKEIHSNYVSSYKRPTHRLLDFKFAINGEDNERYPGEDHHLVLTPQNGQMVSPLYTFGVPDPQEALFDEQAGAGFLPEDVKVTIRVDMRPVLEAFRKDGYYRLFNNEKLAAGDFKGVYLAGSIRPLTWDFASLANKPNLQLQDDDQDGIYELTVPISKYQQAEESEVRQTWTLTQDISRYPQYKSEQVLCDALYNLSLEELLQDVRKDGALMAGAKWPGVWTRDISYSILLSLAIIEPDAAQHSLMQKVKNQRIIQDTGTGGSWPVSTDRMIWALAANEIYNVTGDTDWLKTAFEIIRNSAEDDLVTNLNPATGLMFGESSFLDWREQTYPLWMDPKDIYRSQNLGTNAVHYETYVILSGMATRLNQPQLAEKYSDIANGLKEAINANFWIEEKGYYGQYIYGRIYQSLSPRSESLGAALCVLFNIADENRQSRIITSLPTTDYGTTCIFPQIPNLPPYHNNAIWPFSETYWAWAAAKTGNATSVEHSLAAIYRPAALFLTNKENMVAETGDFMGTEINSDRQLWRLAGNLATGYRIFFGMQFQPDKLILQPFIPRAYAGTRSLKNFNYRNSILDITIEGYGDEIAEVMLDQRPVAAAIVNETLRGHHKIQIMMNNRLSKSGSINLQKMLTTPETPLPTLSDSQITWQTVPGAKQYIVYKNGHEIARTGETGYKIAPTGQYSEYQVAAVAQNQIISFLSQPLCTCAQADSIVVEVTGTGLSKTIPGFTGNGYIPLTRKINTKITFTINLPESGRWAIDFRYSNGNGPINTNNQCAIRSLLIDGNKVGTAVFPQRGDQKCADWGYSNVILANLVAGTHTFILQFQPSDENMNGVTNEALLDQVRLIYLDRQ